MPRLTETLPLATTLTLIFLTLSACKDAPFLADQEASLVLAASKTFLRTGGDTAAITITGYSNSWDALRDGTVVTLSATLGTIQPASVELRGGQAFATFESGLTRGQSKITARSGAATGEITIDIEYSASATITLKASKTSLPSGGGKVDIRAEVTDDKGNPFSGVPVTLATSAGEFTKKQNPLYTNSLGVVTNELDTNETADVTARSLGQSATVRIEVAENTLPTASFTFWPDNPSKDEDVIFDGSSSTDSDGQVAQYMWRFSDGIELNGRRVTRSFSRSGNYQAFLKVKDNRGGISGEESKTVTVAENAAPSASFVYTPTSPTVKEQVTLDGSASSDSDGQIDEWEWSFGDGSTDRGQVVSHSYDAAGGYSVTLTVRDNDGKESETSQSITVGSNSVPSASFSYYPSNPTIDGDVRFDGTASTDSDGTIEKWEWDFGDGSKGSGSAVTHRFKYAGTFYVRLSVRDDDGGTDETTQTVLVSSNHPPSAGFSFVLSTSGDSHEYEFDAGSSTDSDGYIVSYAWDFDDGSAIVTTTSTRITHTFPAAQTYQVRLLITDDKGGKGELVKDVTVQ